MSNTQFAFIDKINIPTRDKLQASIDTLGFDLQLHPEFTPFEDEGFSPCIFNGESDIGFEIYYEPSIDIFEDDEELKKIADNKDYCISMCWGGSMKDCASAMIVSAALAKDFGAIISYEGYDPEPLQKLVSDTQTVIEEARIEEERELASKKAIEEAKKRGTPEQVMIEELKKLEGCPVTGMGAGGFLSISIDNKYKISSKSFSCLCEDKNEISITNYAELRSKQIDLMDQWDGEPTAEQQTEWDNLDALMDDAAQKDEKKSEFFLSEVESWPEELEVSKASWITPNTITVQFKELQNAKLSFFALDDMLFDMNFETDLLSFHITDKEVELYE